MADAKALYRSFLTHLRRLPDPHLWRVLVPPYKALLRSASVPVPPPADAAGAESSRAAARQARRLNRARDQLAEVGMAVACHPHALARLLDKAYAQRGRVRWELLSSMTPTFPPPRLSPLPAPLAPLAPPTPAVSETVPRARAAPPPSAARREALRAWRRAWTGVGVPLVLRADAGATAWEHTGVLDGLRALAGVDERPRPRDLPTYAHLPPALQRVFPRRPAHRAHAQLHPHPRPRPASTRRNPATWRRPRVLSPRLLRRAYARLLAKLVFVRPAPATGRQGASGQPGMAPADDARARTWVKDTRPPALARPRRALARADETDWVRAHA
ncbi:hypothetical protein Q5752_000142 [Cryptotrichosporon argae]